MPSKRIIILNRLRPEAPHYRYVLWADVPAANQVAYRNPAASSAYENATPAELQALREGLVAETSGNIVSDNDSLATMETKLQSLWSSFQAELTAQPNWSDYGRYWDSSGSVWVASAGVPLIASREAPEGMPTFRALTPVSAFAPLKWHFVLHNGNSTTLGQASVVKVRLIAVLPGFTAVTGVAPSAWSLVRRIGPTTPPSGTGGVTPVTHDSAQALPAGITAWNAPSVPPVGGTVSSFLSFVPQSDEQKLTTLDAPTIGPLLSGCGGQVIYRASDTYPAKPLVVRAGETLEVQQSATGGTGNCQILCVFTVG